MLNTIYFVGGDKGGTGKSLVSAALLDEFLQRGAEPLLIETDTANPDVLKMYCEHIQCIPLGLDDGDGWIQLINLAEQARGVPVVVNTAARSGAGMGRYGPTLLATLPELGRRLVTIWVINRQRDSLELLADYVDAMPLSAAHQVHVVRNLYFGQSDRFQLYNSSQIKKQLEANNGKTLDFPDLADRVADRLATGRMTIQSAMAEMPIGDRAELIRWRRVASQVLTQVLA
jgi:hypothetical protein